MAVLPLNQFVGLLSQLPLVWPPQVSCGATVRSRLLPITEMNKEEVPAFEALFVPIVQAVPPVGVAPAESLIKVYVPVASEPP